MRGHALLVLTFLIAACSADQEVGDQQLGGISNCRTTLPSSLNESWRWGGGHGYPDRINPTTCTVVHINQQAADADEQADGDMEVLLRNEAGSSISVGKVVFVDPGVELELTENETLFVAQGVTLASNRGEIVNGAAAPGAKLYTNSQQWDAPLIETSANNIRITGLRIWGSDASYCPEDCFSDPDTRTCVIPDGPDSGTEPDKCPYDNQGVMIKFQNVEVDNNDIGGFGFYSVAVWGTGNDTTRPRIHHNYIHHSQRRGLGYLILVDGDHNERAAADIEWNRLQDYRHAIATSGHRSQDYYARWNWVGEKNIGKFKEADGSPFPQGRAFDVHAEWLRTCSRDSDDEPCVGSYDSQTQTCSSMVDGCTDCQFISTPTQNCAVPPYAGGRIEVQGNIFRSGPDDDADEYSFDVRGKPFHGAWFYGNCTARGGISCAGITPPVDYEQCVALTWPKGGLDSATDGNPTTDDQCDDDEEQTRAVCQRLSGFPGSTQNYYTNVTTDQDPNGFTAWNTYSASPNDCDEGPFNAPERWCISSKGVGPWKYIATSHVGIDEMALGNFGDDARTDIFRATGSNWYVSFSGTDRSWVMVKPGATEQLSDLRFGDFDGDGLTDVLRRNGSAYEYVRSLGNATWGSWTSLSVTPTHPLDELGFGRFNNDTRTDLLWTSGSTWYVWINGGSGWTSVNNSSVTADQMTFEDVDGPAHGDTWNLTDAVWSLPDGSLRYWSPATAVDIARERTYAIYTDSPEATKLHFGRFVSTDRSDAFYSNGRFWWYRRYTGTGLETWVRLAIGAEYADEIAVGYFDSDPAPDVLFPGCQ